MRNMKNITAIALMLATTHIESAFANQSFRASSLDQKVWHEFEAGNIMELLVEFKQGDRLPITLQAQGDFLESSDVNPSYVTVKRPFWIKMTKNKITMSLNGSTFKPIPDLAKGMLTVGASDPLPGGAVNAINVILKAEVK